eukprot:1225707-Rhodomonas_salina.1
MNTTSSDTIYTQTQHTHAHTHQKTKQNNNTVNRTNPTPDNTHTQHKTHANRVRPALDRQGATRDEEEIRVGGASGEGVSGPKRHASAYQTASPTEGRK